MIYNLFSDFFAPHNEELYPPCGLFSLGHILSLVLCLLLVALVVFLNRKQTKDDVVRSCKPMAIIILAFEIIKIVHKFCIGQTDLDHWFPLAYCSFLIYSLFLSGFGKGIWQKMGHAFLSGPSFIAGMAFLIFPTTSLADYPLYHFLSFHSMAYHSVMVYFAVMFYKSRVMEYKFENGKYYLLFLAFFSVIAITMDYTLDCNLFLHKGNLLLIIDIYDISVVLYTIVLFIAFSTMYYIIVLIDLLVQKLKKKGDRNVTV